MCWIHWFLRDERGSATIEFMLWIPIIVALLVTVIDATTLYITHTEMWNVARNTARQMSSGVIGTEAEAEACAANLMSLRDFPYTVDATFDEDAGAQVVIVLPVNDMSIIGYSPLTILGGDMTARVIMRPEPQSTFGTETNPDCASASDPGNGNGKGNGKPKA